MEQVAKAQQHGYAGAAVVEALDDVVERYLLAVLIVLEFDRDMALAVDAKKSVSP